jgi:acetyl esterase/lipase
MWLRYAARIAEEAGVRVVLPRYRLAPEDPFPAGLHDVVAAFSVVAEEGGGKPIVVMGESAGASLTTSLLAAAAASGQRYPDAAIIISPVLDFSMDSTTYSSHAATDPWVSRDSIMAIRENYLQGHPQDDPLASPILADVSSFPPVQLFCGGREVLLGDTIAFAEKLACANRMVEAHFVADAEHGWTFLKPSSPAAKVTMAHILRFIRSVSDPSAQ